MKATFWVLMFGLFVSCSVHAQTLTDPRLQTCPRATEGGSTSPWIQCENGVRFAPISSDALVATGDFTTGTWQKFGALPGETMVAVCPAGAVLESETRCRTADGSAWATRFARKDSLVLPTLPPQRVYTIVWEPVTTDIDRNPITVIGYRVETSQTTEGPWEEAARVGAPPALVTLSSDVQRCFRLFTLREGAESDASAVVCHPAVIEPLSKPAAPIIIKLESAPAP
jgi:hypothetical protein